MRLFSALTAAAFLALCPARPVFAGDNGTSSGLFLQLPVSAAGTGMGDAGVAVVAGSPAIFVNPAGLAGIKGGYASFSHSAWADSISYNVLSAAMKTRGPGVAGFGLRYLSYGEMDSYDNTGAPAGGLSPRDIAVDGAWAAELLDGFSAGLSLRYINSKIQRSASTFAADIGVIQRTETAFFGASLQNAGGSLKYGEENYPLPLNLKAGAGIPYGRDLLAVVDLNLPRGASPWLAVGGKYLFLVRDDMAVSLRAGYNTSSLDTGGVNGFAFGLGLAGTAASFDYSLRTMGELGLTHHIGLNFRWDIAPKVEPPRPSVLSGRGARRLFPE